MSRLRALLPTPVKRLVWEIKYGALGYSAGAAAADVVRQLSLRLSDSSSVLELGCGAGSLRDGMRAQGWQGWYCGVDISRQAIRAAERKRDQRTSVLVSDIESFQTPFRWDAIVMVESIYYINVQKAAEVLRSLSEKLTDSGFLLIRFHDLEKHRAYIEMIQSEFSQTEKVDQQLFLVRSVRRDVHGPLSIAR